MPSYTSECIQCCFVLWHIFSRNLPKSNNGQLTNEEQQSVFIVESDLEYNSALDIRKSYGRTSKKGSAYMKYTTNTRIGNSETLIV